MIDELLHEAGGEVAVLLRLLDWELTRAKATPNPVSPATKRAYHRHTSQLLRERMPVIRALLKEAGDAAIDNHLAANFTPEELRRAQSGAARRHFANYRQAALEATLANLYLGLAKYAQAGNRQLKAIGFDVLMLLGTSDLQHAIKGAVVKNLVGTQGTALTDESPELRRAKTLMRGHLVEMTNDAVVFYGTQLDDTEFEVRNTDPSHRHHGLLLSLDGATHPGYEAMRGSLFHPNSRSLIYRKK